jgi:hypothetical protein
MSIGVQDERLEVTTEGSTLTVYTHLKIETRLIGERFSNVWVSSSGGLFIMNRRHESYVSVNR